MPPDRAETAERITKIVVDHLGVAPEEAKPEAHLCAPARSMPAWHHSGARDGHLGGDSLDVVELVMAIEDELGVEIPDHEAEPLNQGTVADLIDLVQAKLEARS